MVSSIRGLVEVGRWVRRRSGRVRDYPDSGSDGGSGSASCLRGCSQQRGNPGLPVLQPLAVRADSVEGGREQQRMHRRWAVEGRGRPSSLHLPTRLVCPVEGVQQIAGRSAAGEHIAAAIPVAWWPWTRSARRGGGLDPWCCGGRQGRCGGPSRTRRLVLSVAAASKVVVAVVVATPPLNAVAILTKFPA